MKRLITTLTLLALMITPATSALAQARDGGSLDAVAPASVEAAPIASGDEKPGTSTEKSSEVPPGDSNQEPDQGEAAGKNPAEVGVDLYAALKAGKWLVALGFALLVLVALARKFGGTWAKTKTGGYVLGFGIPILGAFGISLSTGTWSLDLFVGAITTGLAASGLYRATKDAKKRLSPGGE
jgi:hypothetical protein